ncbi:MAG: bifunctional DNA-formamidopyrimidine glycosylase/DNA-(apurinic or apyrimidinic site) lyase [Verrucomicrobiae bacterium]|nr:bifunctional DNA-formamidopyrimidine glycosylase/DNA-(apurinic or apyrimidinic site) lyase [Verrucomicrobiae bacterium]
MPELPEVEVLVQHLRPLILKKTIRGVQIYRAKVLAPTSARAFHRCLLGATFTGLDRRGKYLVFELRPHGGGSPLSLIGHLGMTGRMYLARRGTVLPKHAAVVLRLGRADFVYEDPRYFGRLTLDSTALARLGPEPLEDRFSVDYLGAALGRSTQAVKVKLLDQSLVAGVGNIYASEALFRAQISPRLSARKLTARQVARLRREVRAVLREAIRWGSTLPLHHGQASGGDGLFYFGRAANALDFYEERLRVYDREGQPCERCGTVIRRLVQAARSTFYCPRCQPDSQKQRMGRQNPSDSITTKNKLTVTSVADRLRVRLGSRVAQW